MIAFTGTAAILFAYAVCIGMGYMIGIQHKPGRYGRRR